MIDHHPRFRRERAIPRLNSVKSSREHLRRRTNAPTQARLIPCGRPERACEQTPASDRRHCFNAHCPLLSEDGSFESALVAASIIGKQVPATLTDTISIIVMTLRSRERPGRGIDRCESRPAPVSTPIVRERPLDIPRWIQRVPSPMSVTPINDAGVPDHSPAPMPFGKTRIDTRASQEAPPRAGFPGTHHLLPTTGLLAPGGVVRGRVAHHHTRRRHPDASWRRNHVARTWREGCRTSLFREMRAITTGTLGKRPARDLHADARVSFLIYTWRPFYLKGAIKPLICGKVTLCFFVGFRHPDPLENPYSIPV